MNDTYLGGQLPQLIPAGLIDAQRVVDQHLTSIIVNWADRSSSRVPRPTGG